MAKAPAKGGGGGGGFDASRSAAGDRNPWLVAIIVSIAAFMEVLDTAIANVALQHISGGLSVSYDESTWVLTSYLVANAIAIPASSWFASRLGRKNYYMLSVLGFTAASFMCGMAPSLTVLVLARVLQGFAGGGLQPTTQSMLIDSFPPEKRGQSLALFGFTVVLAPTVGPIIGGLITDNSSWRWIFLINVPIGALALFLTSIFVTEPKALQEETRKAKSGKLPFDIWGFSLIGVGLGAMEVFADRGQREDWFASPLIATCAVLAFGGLAAYGVYSVVKKDKAILDLTLLKNRNFLICNLIIMVTGVILYGTTQFIPQFLQQVMGYTATVAGLAMTLGGIATVIFMPTTGILLNKVQPRYLLAFALIVEALALWNLTHWNTNVSFTDAALGRVYQAIGLPFLFIPLTAAAYVGLDPAKTGQASAQLNVFRNLGGTLGISAVQTLLARRQQTHQSQLVENLNPLNPDYVTAVSQTTTGLHGLGAAAPQAALAQIYQQMQRQATMLSYIDVFWCLMVFVAVVLPSVWFLKAGKGGAGAAA